VVRVEHTTIESVAEAERLSYELAKKYRGGSSGLGAASVAPPRRSPIGPAIARALRTWGTPRR
jgi:hypothetical protein